MNSRTTRRPMLACSLGLAATAALALGACSKGEEAAEATAEPTAASTEWTAENPTEAAVPVNVPTTAMTNAPATEAVPKE